MMLREMPFCPACMHRPGVHVEGGLLVVRFVGMGKKIPAQAAVQRQAMVHAPVVLPKDAVFLADIGEVASLRADLVLIHAAGQQFGNLIAGEVDRALVDPEVALALLRVEELHLAADETFRRI